MDSERFWRTEKNFLKEAPSLRQEFETHFANPRETRSERFIWDYWHVPDQYTLIRTPAEAFFSKELYEKLTTALTEYGQKHLGCHELTQPWVSYYVDGCEQQMHADNPHGPWAYVFSLTPWAQREFTGGETFILKPETLNYWEHYQSQNGFEQSNLLTLIEPHFNQLTVFDPRLPHGVRPVHGTKDPLQARLVIHGWFTSPSPFIEGPLSEEEVGDILNNALGPMFDQMDEMGAYTGTLSFSLTVGTDGQVSQVAHVCNTLIALDKESKSLSEIISLITSYLKKLSFASASSETTITLPFIFE